MASALKGTDTVARLQQRLEEAKTEVVKELMATKTEIMKQIKEKLTEAPEDEQNRVLGPAPGQQD